MNKKRTKRIAAFTLIEILIAMAVFSIGILTVLRLITWNMAAIDKVKVKTQATILAKEWMELMYNLRDSNKEKEQAWNCVFNNDMYYRNLESVDSDFKEKDVCNWYLWSWENAENNILQISFDPEVYLRVDRKDYSESFQENFDNNILYYNQGEEWVRYAEWDYVDETWYNIFRYANTWEQASNFARYIVIRPVIASGEKLDTYKILKIESHVLYEKWWYTWEAVLESFMGDY